MSKFHPADYPKFRKWHNGHHAIRGMATEKSSRLSMCDYGLMAITSTRLSPEQLESVRKILTHRLGKDVKMIFRVFAHMPETHKPLAVRMGGGVGAPEGWQCIIKPGTVIVEVDCNNNDKKDLVLCALKEASYKLSCDTKVVSRMGMGG